jgi:hypothetical protein
MAPVHPTLAYFLSFFYVNYLVALELLSYIIITIIIINTIINLANYRDIGQKRLATIIQ